MYFNKLASVCLTSLAVATLAGCNGGTNQDQQGVPSVTATPTPTLAPTATPVVNVQQIEFDFGATWLFNDQGVDLGNDWYAASYNDAAWSQGKGLFGFNADFTNDAPMAPATATTLASYQDVFNGDNDPNPTSYYFRKQLDVSAGLLSALQAQSHLYLELMVDDAALVYLNGVEVARTPLMLEGEARFDAVLGSEKQYSQSTGYVQFVTLRVPTSALVEGENTLAVQVVDRYSSKYPDAAFDAKLTVAHEYADKLDGPYVFHKEDGKVVVQSRSSAGISEQTFADANAAVVEVTLPFELGNFTVELQQHHEPEAWQYDLPEKYMMTSDIEGNIVALVAEQLTLQGMNDIGRFHADNYYLAYSDAETRTTYLPSRLYWARDVVNPFRGKYADRPSKWLGGEDKVGGDLNFHLDRGLAAFGASMMVVGHTVFDDPSFLYGGKVLAVDVDHVDNLAVDNLVEWAEFKDGAYMHHTYKLNGSLASVPVQTLITPEYPEAK